MAKKAVSGNGAEGHGESAQQLNRRILELLNERAKLAGDVDPLAFAQWAVEHNPGPLSSAAIGGIARELASGIRALAHAPRVAYLGPEYSYSHIAALERFGSSTELVPVATIAAVFEEVERGQSAHGLVPIENSTDGRIVDTLGTFAKKPLRITGEVQLRIHHNLLGKGSRADVKEVYSKPQAISQCREWLAKHLPEAKLVEMSSTTKAAQLAAEKPGVAAIASRQAGIAYGLDVIAASIEDNADNVTRFAIIGGDTPKRTGNDKTSLMFQLHHRPGSLADTMNVFKRGKLNLTWIESFPLPGAKAEYLFFAELEGHAADLRVRRALAALEAKIVKLTVLGSYPKATPVE
jgi:chorismate mutase/prephenate dehydratase